MEKIWVEKYRPKKIKHLIGNKNLKERLEKYIEKGEIPNLLLYGSAGTGKSTIAKILVKELNCEYLFIDGSKDNSVEVVRSKVGTFVTSVSFSDLNIVFYEESDKLSIASQSVLRDMTESYTDHSRFIFTCNYPNKFIEPLLSRFAGGTFEIKPPSLDEIEKRAEGILKKENVEYNKEDVKELVRICYPDIRKTIHSLQKFSINGKLNIEKSEILSDSYKSELINLIKKNKPFTEVRQLIINSSNIDYNLAYKMLFDSVDEYCNNDDNKDDMLMDIDEHSYRSEFRTDKEMCLSACILKILKNNR